MWRVHGLGVVWAYTETTAVGQLSPKPFSGGLLSTPLSVAELQMPKSKIRTSRNFPRSRAFDGLGLCFSLGRWCCLAAWVHDLSGTSVVLRSRGPDIKSEEI